MCTDAYSEALTRDLSSTASSATDPTPESGPAMAPAKDAPVVNGEVNDQ
jgi:hypothetical protein